MFRKVLIANRGEIALRVARACRELGIASVAVYSTADRDAAWVRYADEAIHIGPPMSKRSYLNVPNVIGAALNTGADAIHPGYGFLSEDPDFANVCAENDLTFIGPPPHTMALAGDKARIRKHMAAVGLPVLPGSAEALGSLDEAEEIAERIGYPVVIKAVAGGGGRGIALASSAAELRTAYTETVATARAIFGNGDVYLERFVVGARHVEVQILADSHGSVVHLGERDCSLQRRRQKLVEESPAPGIDEATRRELCAAAVRGVQSLDYCGAATMEFLVAPNGEFSFMEINARIQVEHPVTEMVTGIDLVQAQIRVAAGAPLGFGQQDIANQGVAIECRVNAEDPDTGFRPTPGRLTAFRPPSGPWVRVDGGFHEGDTVPAHYDSLMAKVIVWAPDREAALSRMDRALAEFQFAGGGMSSTIPLSRRLLGVPEFRAGRHDTALVDQVLLTGGESC
nr:acetyl-CoA carboxylase biotin carboxylase subunit [Kibdelosporangium sp. MJ126-NF4]CEL19971.1 Biotin carboxylase of acetyl-CoA carboxylase [Kibdelosporangium sp. MJ126-NF4]CTQ97195.1 Biotin carboxylase of acetyl-CoA carboxylase (EC 6.3.4.14) [Kibdelosporangium sp. MJ126-NF4]